MNDVSDLSVHHRELSSSSRTKCVEVTITTTVLVSSFSDFNSTDALYSYLTNKLNSSISSGNFTQSYLAVAGSYNVSVTNTTGVVGASSLPAEVYDYTDSPSSYPTAVPSFNLASTSQPTRLPTAQSTRLFNSVVFASFGCVINAVWFDSFNRSFLVDNCAHVVRLFNFSLNITSVFAGSENHPSYSSFDTNGDGGMASLATFNRPWSISSDSTGNYFVSDQKNNKIRRISVSGIISTYAGDGRFGYNGDNIAATAASLAMPAGMWVDTIGTLYFADSRNQRIRKIFSSNQIISTIIGVDGITSSLTLYPYGQTCATQTSLISCQNNIFASSASMKLPTGVVGDSFGNLYVADTYNNVIRKIDTNGIIKTIAGTGLQLFDFYEGDATMVSLNIPSDVWLDTDNNLFISDTGNNLIRKVNLFNNIISTVVGTRSSISYDDNVATATHIIFPTSLHGDAHGFIYVADTGNRVVRKVCTKSHFSACSCKNNK
eukprot:gene7074-9654_t